MMEDVNLQDGGGEHHSVVGGFRFKRRNALIIGIIVILLIVIIVPIIILVPGGGGSSSSSSGSSSGGGVSANGDALKQELINVYGRSDFHLMDVTQLDVKDSPQNKAYLWLKKNKHLKDYDHGTRIQRFALATFFYATNGIKTPYSKDGPAWKESKGWLSDENECEKWMGLECNENNHILKIDLEDNGLTGQFPPEMSWLPHIETLDLTTNFLHLEGEDALDVLGVFKNLHTMLLDDNYIVTDDGLPESIGKLEHLHKLRLSYNLLRGPMNNGVLDNLSKLTHLEIESNFLSGPIPPVIGTWDQLVYLYMRRNALTMDLKFLEAGQMKNLFSMWLDSNNIAGSIPTEVGLLTELASLSLTDAGLGGVLPSEIGNLSGLRRFWIYTNKIEGEIPAEIGNLPILEVFETHDNLLVGTMPNGVCQSVAAAEYASKSLTADCEEVTCPLETCCTECYP